MDAHLNVGENVTGADICLVSWHLHIAEHSKRHLSTFQNRSMDVSDCLDFACEVQEIQTHSSVSANQEST